MVWRPGQRLSRNPGPDVGPLNRAALFRDGRHRPRYNMRQFPSLAPRGASRLCFEHSCRLWWGNAYNEDFAAVGVGFGADFMLRLFRARDRAVESLYRSSPFRARRGQFDRHPKHRKSAARGRLDQFLVDVSRAVHDSLSGAPQREKQSVYKNPRSINFLPKLHEGKDRHDRSCNGGLYHIRK